MAIPAEPQLLDLGADSEQEIKNAVGRQISPSADTHEFAGKSAAMETGSGYFTGKDGSQLYEQWWRPEDPKAVVALVHGYAEHSGRYAHVAETFVENGYAVYSYDHRSHGKSDGNKTFISSFDDVVDELDLFMEHIEPRVGDLPFFVLGHSMGGLILSLYMAHHQPPVKGVILTGPYVEVNENVPSWLVSMSSIVGKLLPYLPTIGLDYRLVSRDPEMLAKHQADPYIHHGKLPARTGAEMNQAVQKINGMMEQITAPLLVMHGSDDQIAPVSGSKKVHARASTDDKSLKIYDGLYHEILNELEREEVKADIVSWMDDRYSVAG